VGGRRGGLGYLYAAFAVLSLVCWSLLGGRYQRLQPPGEDEINYIHVVCPNNCGNQWWETAYSPHTVTACDCEGDWVPMVRCKECLAQPGLHRPPEGWPQEGRQ
jgi:hypothetical protein